jgi:hypothetical protein
VWISRQPQLPGLSVQPVIVSEKRSQPVGQIGILSQQMIRGLEFDEATNYTLSMGVTTRIMCYLPLALAALDEPTNAITISFFSWVASAEPTQYFSHSQRPARGLDDVTDLARSLPPPSPSLQEGVTEILLRTLYVTFEVQSLSHDPESIPLLC